MSDLNQISTAVVPPLVAGATTFPPSSAGGTMDAYHCAHGGTTSGGAGGGKVTPTAVLIMKGERVELFSIKNATANGTIDKVINMVPEVISHFTKKKEKKEEVREAALKEGKEAMAEEAETAAIEAKGSAD